MKKIIWSVLVVIVVIAGFVWLNKVESTEAEIVAEKGAIISENGLHWHPELRIFVKGGEITIPENIGLAAVHNPIHTHDDLPIVHLEFDGLVYENDTTLGKFFESWGKDFMEFGTKVTMMVNDEPNTELQDYKMKDGDKIELHYE